MKYLLAGAALLLAPAAFAQTTPAQPAPSAPGAQTSADTQSMSTATDSSGVGPATASPAKPTVGATVYGSAGTPVGTIKAMDAQFVTLTTAKGDIRLPAAGVGAGPNGPTIAMTAEQLGAAIDQAKAAQPVATSKTTSAETTGDGTATKTKTTTRKRSR